MSGEVLGCGQGGSVGVCGEEWEWEWGGNGGGIAELDLDGGGEGGGAGFVGCEELAD